MRHRSVRRPHAAPYAGDPCASPPSSIVGVVMRERDVAVLIPERDVAPLRVRVCAPLSTRVCVLLPDRTCALLAVRACAANCSGSLGLGGMLSGGGEFMRDWRMEERLGLRCRRSSLMLPLPPLDLSIDLRIPFGSSGGGALDAARERGTTVG